jgi:hypothetical protein
MGMAAGVSRGSGFVNRSTEGVSCVEPGGFFQHRVTEAQRDGIEYKVPNYFRNVLI